MSIVAPTVIYAFHESNSTIPTWYPNGADVIISSGDPSEPKPTYTLEQNGNYYSILVTNQDFDGKSMRIEIVPK